MTVLSEVPGQARTYPVLESPTVLLALIIHLETTQVYIYHPPSKTIYEAGKAHISLPAHLTPAQGFGPSLGPLHQESLVSHDSQN